MSTDGNKIFDDLTNVFSEAAKRNAEAMKQGFDLLKDSMRLPYDLSRIISEGSSTLSKGFAEYLRLNVEHASHLLDLSRSLSNELLSSLEHSGSQASSSPQPTQGQSVSELHLSGSPGDLCRSAFVLESKKSGKILARVFHSRFVNQADNTPVTIPLVFDPREVTVSTDEKIRIVVETGIPENTDPGIYQSMVWIDGFPELSLRLLLNVVESKESAEPQKEIKVTP
jgi:hypothetical protein